MLFLYLAFVTCCLALLAGGVVEQRNHHRHLHSIPARILVNGSRGKSSITRLCAGALRGGGLMVVAKTTGTAARFIYPDATEEPIYRKFGIANVAEQISIVRRAAAFHPDALVIECMAVNPSLQEVNQTKLIQSNVGVLCNVREDHLEEMGPKLDDVARSLSRSMPVGGICITAERERLPILRRQAAKRRCRLIEVDPAQVTDRDMAGFGWITFKENVAIALAVAELLGIDRRAALRGMWQAPPDPGALTVEEYRVAGKRLRFANVFAANDPGSTLQNIRMLWAQGAIRSPVHLVINCRPDRIERNRQMGALVPAIRPARVFLIGEPTRSARAAVPEQWQDLLVDLGGRRSGDELLAGLLRGIGSSASVVAVGNIHGQGERLLEALARLEPAVPAGPPPADPAATVPAPRSPVVGPRSPAVRPRVTVRGRSRDRW